MLPLRNRLSALVVLESSFPDLARALPSFIKPPPSFAPLTSRFACVPFFSIRSRSFSSTDYFRAIKRGSIHKTRWPDVSTPTLANNSGDSLHNNTSAPAQSATRSISTRSSGSQRNCRYPTMCRSNFFEDSYSVACPRLFTRPSTDRENHQVPSSRSSPSFSSSLHASSNCSSS